VCNASSLSFRSMTPDRDADTEDLEELDLTCSHLHDLSEISLPHNLKVSYKARSALAMSPVSRLLSKMPLCRCLI
jgi:hypothetical protein